MSEPPELHPERMLAVLLRHKVRFVILGGYGAMVHHVEGMEPTTDIDICPLLDDANLARLRAALDELGAEPYFGETARPNSLGDLLANRERLEQTKAVMLVTEWGALDLVIRPDGISRGYRTLEPAAEIRPAVDRVGTPSASMSRWRPSGTSTSRRRKQAGRRTYGPCGISPAP